MKEGRRARHSRGVAAFGLPRLLKQHGMQVFSILCALSLAASLSINYWSIQANLYKTCANVADDFASIMTAYKHSFGLMEKYLQLEIATAKDTDEIEAFLKAQDTELLAIEGDEYDGVYMYYQGKYLYSWNTPFSVYESSGYDATKRPWYIGAALAKGAIFITVPYPSYANNYMLATVSRLQPDGETVIAYDIKLGEIGKYVDKLDVYDGSLTLICDTQGNVIGSTDRYYQGGNYRLTDAQLEAKAAEAQAEYDAAGPDAKEKALAKLKSAQEQSAFFSESRDQLEETSRREKTLIPYLRDLTLGYAYSDGTYTCFVLLPISHCLLNVAVLWAALSFASILALICLGAMLRRSNQIVMDALTGLNNRRALLKYCGDHIAHHPEDELCLIMLDLNDFKKINDQHGHIAGDHALLDAADALRQTCAEAPADFFLCRYGGDEFLLAGCNCSQEDVDATIALIKNNLRLKNQAGNEPYTLEISSGVARGKGTDSTDIEKLLAQADNAMYQDKMRMKETQTLKKK